jgi:ligand-binding sensor domain-containing protein
MKFTPVYTLFLMSVFLISCGQTKTFAPPDNIESETKDTVTSYGPNTMVRNIKKDRNGNILIASYLGVFRYDGKWFTNITSGIPSPSFWDVLEDRKGNLWFGTRDSGVYRFNGKSFQHFTTRQGLANNQAIHIYEDKVGNIWFATAGGASCYDGNSFRNFTTKDGLPNNAVTTFMEDTTGKLWFGTRGEACVYDGRTFTVLKNKDGKSFKNVWSIIKDKKGSIWFGDVDGLWRYDDSTFTKVSQKDASAIIEDKKGNIWTTGEVTPNKPNIGNDWVLSRYDAKSLYNKMPTVTEIRSRYEGSKGMLCGMLEDNDGSIFCGSFFGVYRYDGKTLTDFKSKKAQQ